MKYETSMEKSPKTTEWVLKTLILHNFQGRINTDVDLEQKKLNIIWKAIKDHLNTYPLAHFFGCDYWLPVETHQFKNYIIIVSTICVQLFFLLKSNSVD